jgi:hypothetical protein
MGGPSKEGFTVYLCTAPMINYIMMKVEMRASTYEIFIHVLIYIIIIKDKKKNNCLMTIDIGILAKVFRLKYPFPFLFLLNRKSYLC